MFINTAFILWAFRLSENPAAPIDPFAFLDSAILQVSPFELVFKARLPGAEIRKLCAVSLNEEI